MFSRNVTMVGNHIDAASQLVAEMDQGRERHISPVRAAPHRNSVRVWKKLPPACGALDPRNQRAYVFYGVLSFNAIN